MEENSSACCVTAPPPDPASDPAKVETVMSTALAAGISPEAALNSENQVILGSQLGED